MTTFRPSIDLKMSCPDCFNGHTHTQTPTGTVTTLHGIPTYVAQPEEGVPKGVIVMVTDAFGWDFVNNRVLCDQYAKKGGFIVYCPDFMMGTCPSPRMLHHTLIPLGNAMDFYTVTPLMKGLITPASWFTTIFYKPIYVLKAMYNVIPWFIKTRPSVTKPRIFNWFSTRSSLLQSIFTAELELYLYVSTAIALVNSDE